MKNNQINHISRHQYVIEFDPKKEHLIKVNSGDIVDIDVMCSSRGHVNRRVITTPEKFREEFNNYSPGMALAGPIAVSEAKSGDILMIEILKLEVDDQGWAMASQGKGAICDIVDGAESRIIPVVDNYFIYEQKYKHPINPMIGCIGTTPRNKINAGWPGDHGGNLDCKEIKEGATLLLPVTINGGNLALGDLHSAQGDGEVGCSGIETGGKVRIKITLLKNLDIPLPFLITTDAISTIATAPTLDEAAKKAVEQMVIFLSKATNESIVDMGILVSLVGDIRICQMVDPAMTCRMEMPLDFVKKELCIDIFHLLLENAVF